MARPVEKCKKNSIYEIAHNTLPDTSNVKYKHHFIKFALLNDRIIPIFESRLNRLWKSNSIVDWNIAFELERFIPLVSNISLPRLEF